MDMTVDGAGWRGATKYTTAGRVAAPRSPAIPAGNLAGV